MTRIWKTERLCVRPCYGEDAAALFEIFSDSGAMRYWSGPPHDSVEVTRKHIDSMADSTWRHWVFAETSDGPAIGKLAATEKRAGVVEIGYMLARKHWSKGYASEAVSWLIDMLWAEGNRRIVADTDPENRPSNLLLSKLGFKKEGVLREEWLTHIGIRDSFVWGLLRTEWRGSRTKRLSLLHPPSLRSPE